MMCVFLYSTHVGNSVSISINKCIYLLPYPVCIVTFEAIKHGVPLTPLLLKSAGEDLLYMHCDPPKFVSLHIPLESTSTLVRLLS